MKEFCGVEVDAFRFNRPRGNELPNPLWCSSAFSARVSCEIRNIHSPIPRFRAVGSAPFFDWARSRSFSPNNGPTIAVCKRPDVARFLDETSLPGRYLHYDGGHQSARC